MYSEQLETIIKSIIADGEITEKERAVLHKKAEAEGVDIDEIDVYVDGLIGKSSQEGNKKKLVRQYNKNLLIKESSTESGYYKFQKEYLSIGQSAAKGPDISIRFADIADCSFWNKISDNDRYKGFCILVSFAWSNGNNDVKLQFKDNNKDILLVTSHVGMDCKYNWGSRIILLQSIGGNTARQTIGYNIDDEQLKLLCDTPNIQLNFTNLDNFRVRDLPGFQYYAQCFYRATIDPNAYPNAEQNIAVQETSFRENLEAAKKKENIKKLFGQPITWGCIIMLIWFLVFFIIMLSVW